MTTPGKSVLEVMIQRHPGVYEEERLVLEAGEVIMKAMDAQDVLRAEMADRLGVSRASVSQVLSGRNMTLRKLAQMLFALGLRATITVEKI